MQEAETALGRAWRWLLGPSDGAQHRSALLDALCIGFALWTVACQLTVFAKGNLYQLLWTLGGLLAVLLVAFVWAFRRYGHEAVRRFVWAPQEQGVAIAAASSGSSGERVPPWLFILAALAVAVAYFIGRDPLWLWGSTVVFFALACGTLGSTSYCIAPLRSRRYEEALLIALALGCALICLVALRSSSDDTFYVNLAVGVADAPERPILQYNTMLGVPDLELNLPIYKAHTIEVLAGLLAWLTPLTALVVSQLVLSAIAAFVMPLALARLSSLLLGSRFLWCTLCVVLFLAVEGSAYEGYANHALVRFQHGKSIALSVGVPLLLSYALEFMLRPSLRGFVLLAAVQIASTGLTGTSIWLAPTCVGLSSLVLWRPNLASTRHWLWAVSSSAYVAVLGLWLRAEMQLVYDPAGKAERSEQLFGPALNPARVMFSEALSWALGSFNVQAVLIFCLLAAFVACEPATLGRRFAILYPALFFAGIFCPFTAQFWRSIVAFYWRVFWVLPLPFLFGVLATGWLRVFRGRFRLLGPVTMLLWLGAFYVFVPDVHTLSRENSVRFSFLGKKVGSEFRVAQEVNRLAGPHAHALAPEDVSIWMTVEHHHAFPLSTKPKYLRTQVSMPKEEARRRELLLRYVESVKPDLAEDQTLTDVENLFEASLRQDELEVVCFVARGKYSDTIREILKRHHYDKQRSLDGYELWKRALPDDESANGRG